MTSPHPPCPAGPLPLCPPEGIQLCNREPTLYYQNTWLLSFLSVRLFLFVILSICLFVFLAQTIFEWISLSTLVISKSVYAPSAAAQRSVLCVAAHKTICILPWNVVGPQLRKQIPIQDILGSGSHAHNNAYLWAILPFQGLSMLKDLLISENHRWCHREFQIVLALLGY